MLEAPRVDTPSRVRLYADEIKPQTNSRGQRWMYLGLLALPGDRHGEALGVLLKDRTEAGFDGELHFSRLASREATDLAGRWLDKVMWDDPRGLFRFHVLGIRLDHLRREAFGGGGSKQVRRIHARTFRMAAGYGLKRLFRPPVQVEAIFHDKGDMEHDRWFDWHTPWRLGRDLDDVEVLNDRVIFLDSDHRNERRHPGESHLIQLADLLLGAIRQCLDASSGKIHQNELARRFLPLVKRLVDPSRVGNPNSRYRYAGRCSLSFFPKHPLSSTDLQDSWERLRPSFHVGRELLLDVATGQGTLI